MQAGKLVIVVFFGTILTTAMIWWTIDRLTEEDVHMSGASSNEKLEIWIAPTDFVNTPPPQPIYNSMDSMNCKAVVNGLYEDAVVNQNGVMANENKLNGSYK